MDFFKNYFSSLFCCFGMSLTKVVPDFLLAFAENIQ